MKVCELCGCEISTRDGENRCRDCGEQPHRNRKGRRARKSQVDSVMESLGLTKVRGARGGTYWE